MTAEGLQTMSARAVMHLDQLGRAAALETYTELKTTWKVR